MNGPSDGRLQPAPGGGAGRAACGARLPLHLPVKGVRAVPLQDMACLGRPTDASRVGRGGGGPAASGSTAEEQSQKSFPEGASRTQSGEEGKGFPGLAEAPLLSVLHPGIFMQQIIWEENESRA